MVSLVCLVFVLLLLLLLLLPAVAAAVERGLEGMAVCAYTRALRFAAAAHLRVPLLCNRALAQLRSKPRVGVSAAAAAERDAREAVSLDPDCPKAYYRFVPARLSRMVYMFVYCVLHREGNISSLSLFNCICSYIETDKDR